MNLPLIITLITAAIIIISLVFFSLIYLKLHRRRTITPLDLERGPTTAKVADESTDSVTAKPDSLLRRFTWPEIESLTGNFTPSSIIGHGGFSTVYLAHIPTLSALKIHRSSERLHRIFTHELTVLRRLNHRHVIRLLGYAADTPDAGALVFEYIANGTLHQHLHGGHHTLPWAHRTKIAYQVALAMEYLHEDGVVHGDVKAANVLLDGGLDVKLCDFGSARIGFSAVVCPAEKNAMMGSPGYVDPHYLRTGMVSKKSDVYSFGVLLLELVTGNEAFCPVRDRPLTSLVRLGDVAVDERLDGVYEAAEAAAMAAVAARCVGEQPSVRPAMGEVVEILREKVRLGVDEKGKNGRGEL